MLESSSSKASTSRHPGDAAGFQIQILRQLHMFHVTVKRTRMKNQKAAHDVGGEAQKASCSGLSSPVLIPLIFKSSRYSSFTRTVAATCAAYARFGSGEPHPA